MSFSRADFAFDCIPKNHSNRIEARHSVLYGYERFDIIIKDMITQRIVGKKIGTYSTLVTGKPPLLDKNEIQNLHNALVASMKELFSIDANLSKSFLIVGLGNRFVTSDSIGVRVIDCLSSSVSVSEHILGVKSPKFYLFIPGVFGQTGIEALDAIRGALEACGASCVILIDSLSSKSIDRLCSTIQISNAGLSPGSGVGNKRCEIDKEALGIPVFSIGVPTVMSTSTLIHDKLDSLGLEAYSSALEDKNDFFVSPNDCDLLISSFSKIISSALFEALTSKK